MVKGLKTYIFFIAKRFQIASLITNCHPFKKQIESCVFSIRAGPSYACGPFDGGWRHGERRG